MASDSARTLLHPVRMRIVLALGADDLTTAQLAQALPDVAQATLYRHVGILVEAGIIQVVGERQARGAVERTYRLVESEASLGQEDALSMTVDEHRTGFSAFAGAVVAQFGAYLDSPCARVGEDPLGYRQVALWLDDADVERLVSDMVAAVERFEPQRAGEGRRKYHLSTVFVPAAARGGAEA